MNTNQLEDDKLTDFDYSSYLRPRQLQGLEYDLGDELLVYSAELEIGFSFNHSAKAIWELCDGNRSLTDISEELAGRFGCDGIDLFPDVIATIEQMQQHGLVELEEDSPLAAYVQIDNFLELERVAELLARVQQESAKMLDKSQAGSTKTLDNFSGFSDLFVQQVQMTLLEVVEELGLTSFPITKIEIKYVAQNEEKFSPSADKNTPTVSRRKLIFVYSFYQEPKAFSGGELTFDKSKDTARESWQQIEPRHNSIVFLPGHYRHEIRPISRADQSFSDNYFFIYGWICK